MLRATMLIALGLLASAAHAGGPPCRVVRVAVDGDVEFTQTLFGGDAAAAETYMADLVGAVSEIFERDLNVTLDPVFLRAWDAEPDPYSSSDGPALLDQAKNEFTANLGDLEREIVFLFSGKNLDGAIITMTTLDSVCQPDIAFSLITAMQGTFPMPIEDFNGLNNDPFLFARGIALMLGADLLRDIDENLDPCFPFCGGRTGTIMSSCFSCGGTSEIQMAFHPAVIEQTLAVLEGVPCDLNCGGDCLADWNTDGQVLTDDFLAYLNDYVSVLNGGEPVFGDPDLAEPFGTLNSADFLAYLNLFAAGCG